MNQMIYKFNTLKIPIRGGIIGLVLGLIFTIGYILTSVWLCSGIRSCPAHWFPFVITGTLIWTSTIISSIFISVILQKMYYFCDVSGNKK